MNYKIIDKNSTYVDRDVKVGEGTIIYPNVTIRGKTVIGKNNIIESNTIIIDSKIENDNKIISSYIINTEIDNNNSIGPFSHLRDGVKIGNYNKIGNFVELKNTIIKDNNRISHLSYVGDTKMGNNVNFSGGAITANYNCEKKTHFETVIYDNVVVGVNAVLVAPVVLNKNSFVGAGTVVVKDIKENSLVVGPREVEEKDNYVEVI